ncbi:ketohydroxyglutarate aldolase [Pontibacillus halophilus JSM 076056 = DSM 19796]|uniref:Ketohydroxyglutarate aldolase n=1 Tax=Pontibacillus halophilus JSM 076056 = DSM 19796 TaxID=1385510 RepID=A0A0A5GFI9_9BACI|nr:bifunctional 2-keto-4-hydroxyglutarate aldolase/2-keto-3-deoxy-6-phosphogluconate aldolase [Pontibacillus halophilus]KGX89973.1 ketohydroxyglutarate aldolase [Pontibacillus halophilus JSM 076056 = DSM 19796]
MKYYRILSQLIDHKLTVVVRGNTKEEAIAVGQACLDGGVKSLEVTFTVPNADEVIAHFAERPEIVVGAGSVLDAETARIAILAGAQYIVGPSLSEETAVLCNRYQIPYIPGCFTVNEMIRALEFGASVVKLFPGQSFDPSYIKAVKGPVPQVEIMPTGGVNLENVQEWLDAGAIMVGVGGEVTKPAKHGDYEGVTKNAMQFVAAIGQVNV